ncbi:MAG TPA: 1-acyl-sn-glycerol-3-phosphate acyltransferase [Clostridiaceae bacterium]|jgi:1-acyl-sn-glycerol-3-phosphate acyltransferase|nr:1-acyl-sn-glycerol-3-phosphate acyltransferase [Clostridiaceae bacterium]
MAEFTKLLCRIIFKLIYRVELIDIENVPSKGGAILCANHPGTLDMFFIGYKLKRLIHYMAKGELFKNPIMSFIMHKLGCFPVKRGKPDIESIKTAISLINEGHIVGILPEGTRTGFQNRKKIRAKPGVAMVATKVNTPIIPVAVSGDYRLFSKVKVVYGKPFYLDLDKDKKYTMDELRQISQRIMDKIYSLLGEK